MSSKKDPRDIKADEAEKQQLQDFQTKPVYPDEAVCQHGNIDASWTSCPICEADREAREILHEITERANRQAILDLANRFGDDPPAFVRVVFREGYLHCAMNLIAEGQVEVVRFRDAYWQLLLAILRSAPGKWHPFGTDPSNGVGFGQRELACGLLSAVAPSKEALTEVLRSLLDDEKWGVRNLAASELAKHPV